METIAEWCLLACCFVILIGGASELVFKFYYEVIKGDPSHGGTRVCVPVYRWERRS